MDAAADFLVRGEGDAHRAVGDARVGEKVAGGGHDDGDAGLVVGAEQGGAAGGDDVVALLGGEVGRLGRREHEVGCVGKADLAPVVAAVDDRPDTGRVELGRGVDVGEERDRRGGDGAGNGREDRAVAGQAHVGGADAR